MPDTPLYTARTTVPSAGIVYRGTAAQIIRETAMHAKPDDFAQIPADSFREFAGDFGRCWRVKVVTDG